jgi:hypothetical protein
VSLKRNINLTGLVDVGLKPELVGAEHLLSLLPSVRRFCNIRRLYNYYMLNHILLQGRDSAVA